MAGLDVLYWSVDLHYSTTSFYLWEGAVSEVHFIDDGWCSHCVRHLLFHFGQLLYVRLVYNVYFRMLVDVVYQDNNQRKGVLA